MVEWRVLWCSTVSILLYAVLFRPRSWAMFSELLLLFSWFGCCGCGGRREGVTADAGHLPGPRTHRQTNSGTLLRVPSSRTRKDPDVTLKTRMCRTALSVIRSPLCVTVKCRHSTYWHTNSTGATWKLMHVHTMCSWSIVNSDNTHLL